MSTTAVQEPDGTWTVTATHTYASHDLYPVTAVGGAGRTGAIDVDTKHQPLVLEWTVDLVDALVGHVTITSADAPDGTDILVDFGDATGPVEATINDGVAVVNHTYTEGGQYTISAADDTGGWVGDVIVLIDAAHDLLLDWEVDSVDPLKGIVTIDGIVSYPVLIQWGDGATTTLNSPSTWAQHTYSEPGTYDLVASDSANGAGQLQVRVHAVGLTVEADAHTVNPMIVYARVMDAADGNVTIDLGDSQEDHIRTVVSSGGETDWTGYLYESPGTYTITAEDTMSVVGDTTYTATLPSSYPQLTWTPDSGEPLCGVLTITNAYRGGYITWDDGESTVVESEDDNPPPQHHCYAEAGPYTINFVDGARREAHKNITVSD